MRRPDGNEEGLRPVQGRDRALAIGSAAIGALAVGAVAIGAMAIGKLSIGRARLKRLEVDELSVNHLRIAEVSRTDRLTSDQAVAPLLETSAEAVTPER